MVPPDVASTGRDGGARRRPQRGAAPAARYRPGVRVTGLWRYPVKSMQGEALGRVELTEVGVAGDRCFGVLDVASGTVVSAKRDGRMLEASARLVGPALRVALPGAPERGPGGALDAAMGSWLGREVRLVAADPLRPARFESSGDFEHEDAGVTAFEGVAGSLVDSSPLHLLCVGELESLAAERPELDFDLRRFRPNVLLDAAHPPKARARYRLGGATVEVVKACERCVMTTRPQPGGIERELEVLRHLASQHASRLGMLARVLVPGPVEAGDAMLRER